MPWMKNGAGDEIRVNEAQVRAFEARGYALFDKPAAPGPKVVRQPGRQMNMGSVVRMEKGDDVALADPRQVSSMESAGWKVSEKQPQMEPAQHAYRELRGKDPVSGRVRMRHPSGAECFADDAQVAAMQASGWVAGSSAMPQPTVTISGTIYLQEHIPPVALGQSVTVEIYQEVQGAGQDDKAGIQFSNGPSYPGEPHDNWQWTTARPLGGGGAVEANPVSFDQSLVEWSFPGIVWSEPAWIRVGVWPDQSLSGDPMLWSPAEKPALFGKTSGEPND